ncbi:putative F-box/LRR-repeat protein At3g18150 [Morus notabilis]|uniref:putative F-box/LRR-repeat protein At3g18150 n=1 Tax=Morus notabilis TaxID=981085 RepID=UPI000CED505A|nr:putative F-box/LRR-repeat protein At3g18150 [Morus notabilis]XP_024017478.1 putative F-box/LRR-repeat protein At3g18150 [Morus notabilis]XP_024017479.1 putative F-box/LRR-repeat protein At3g18150 [Morus notabilis]
MATKSRKRGKGMKHGPEHESVFQDRISELPDGIILHILSLLPTIDAVRTGLLSKRWRRMWALIPVLDFCDSRDIDDFRRDDHDETNIGQKKFDMFVDECFAHTYAGASISKFKLDVTYYGCRRRLDGWLRFPMKKNVQELDLSVQPEGRSARISLYCLPNFILHLGALTLLKLSGVVLEAPVPSSLPSLKELYLVFVRMTDQVLNNLVFGCPSLEKLHVHYCDGLRNPKVSSLSMKSMEFITREMHYRCETIKVEAINLHSFEHTGSFSCKLYMNLVHCRTIRNLSLMGASITDQWLEDLIPQLPLLESLKLTNCYSLQNLKIGNQHLKDFALTWRHPQLGLLDTTIDAPNLVSFSYHGFSFFKISVNAPNLLDVAIRVPDRFRKTYDAEWHTSLIKFLSEFNGSKNVSVVCSYEQALIIPDEVTNMYSSPLPDLKYMKVRIDGQLFSKAMLRKSLLWIAPSNLETLPIG